MNTITEELRSKFSTIFHLTIPDLIADYFCALFRPLMLIAVIDIVAEHIPNLEALNLDGNKLAIIERLNVLTKKLPKLKILYIGENRVSLDWINEALCGYFLTVFPILDKGNQPAGRSQGS